MLLYLCNIESRYLLCYLILIYFFGENVLFGQNLLLKPHLSISENERYLVDQQGKPFFWLGGTVWGMSEWMTREEIDLYLDDRNAKGFNVIQICLFWGKRTEDPVSFTVNPPNAYGHSAFVDKDGKVDGSQPLIIEGGDAENPNDYWDHVDYIIQAIEKRNMFVALLPVWGRRYVNATHSPFSQPVFSKKDMKEYGKFLGERYGTFQHIIWVMGGDVKADDGGDYLSHYRAMAEGIIQGVTGKKIRWDQDSEYWDYAFMTYHPNGIPLLNSSRWFHKDPWLDVNMVETWQHRDSIYLAITQDYELTDPVKPTVMGEPSYEWNGSTRAIHVRRQAYQSIFAGAAGFTYGAFRDSLGNGPLFSPYKGWEKILTFKGAQSLSHLKEFCLENGWPHWRPMNNVIVSGKGEGELQKVAVITESGDKILIYYPDISVVELDLSSFSTRFKVKRFNPSTGEYTSETTISSDKQLLKFIPNNSWEDSILMLTKSPH